MRIAVISDLHAFNSQTWDKDGSPSHYDIVGEGPATQCPIRSLLEHVKSNNLSADLLLCPGDFANHACAASLPIAWEAICTAGELLRARAIVGTVGNHDVDSRHIHNKYDPIQALKSLKPMFPINDRDLKNQFWSEHFFVQCTDEMQLVVVNSSAYHTTEEEIEHGRIAPQTLNLLRDSLQLRPLNVLLCHHNPQKHSELLLGDLDEIRGGQLLLDLVGEPGKGNWLVIHGHKHHPKITFAAGGVSSPIVFSAGSIASKMYPELQAATGNQFYIIEVDKNEVERRGLVGRFESWDWHQGYGWQLADSKMGLPAKGGFGHRENSTSLARRIVASISRKKQKFLRGGKIIQKFPELAYVSPSDLRVLVFEMERLSAVLDISDSGEVREVSLK